MIVLTAKIPCENCSNAIKKTLKNVKGVVGIECSVAKSEILIKTEKESEDEDEDLKRKIIELLAKTGRVAQ